jgi:hypothetical protein
MIQDFTMTRISMMVMLAGLGLIAGCTAVTVQPLAERPAQVCIKKNPAVIVDDFLPVVQEGFSRHNIATFVYDLPPLACPYVLEYTARQTWDMAIYLVSADLTIRNSNGREVGKAHYHLRNRGGLSLMKWQGTETKIAPVIDELLGQMQAGAVKDTSSVTQSNSMSPDKTQQQKLDELANTPGLSYEEYQRRYREISNPQMN